MEGHAPGKLTTWRRGGEVCWETIGISSWIFKQATRCSFIICPVLRAPAWQSWRLVRALAGAGKGGVSDAGAIEFLILFIGSCSPTTIPSTNRHTCTHFLVGGCVQIGVCCPCPASYRSCHQIRGCVVRYCRSHRVGKCRCTPPHTHWGERLMLLFSYLLE